MEYLIVIFIFGLMALGVLLLYPLSKRKSGVFNYFFLNIMPIVVACAGTLTAVYFTEKSTNESIQEIQKAMYPDEFLVGLYMPDQQVSTKFYRPSSNQFNRVVLKNDEMMVNVRISNRSKYPATNLPISILISDDSFDQSSDDVIKSYRERLIYGYSVREGPEAVIEAHVGQQASVYKLHGCMFVLDYIEGEVPGYKGEPNYHCLDPVKLTLNSDIGYFAVKVRHSIYYFYFINEINADKYTVNKSYAVDESSLSGPDGVPCR